MAVILGGNTSIYLASLTPPASQLLLDAYPNAAVAYSLRKLRTAYSGSAIRVRRSSDNTEQDINFLGDGSLDTATILDFVGYNMWTYSEDISNAAYGNSLSTETINSITAPDGNLTGGKVIENLTLGEHGLNRGTTTILNATNYNISAYFKQGERTKIKIYSNISGATQNCDLDLTNGNISNNGFANTPIVTAEANGWYRFSVTITSGTTSATFPFQFRIFNASNSISYTGDGTSGVYVWGYQLSQTSTVKTYQKTVATAGGNGFVSIWYDQSTNVNNSIQTSPTSQAQVVLNGNLITDVTTGKITTTWTNDSYTLASGISTNTQYLSVSMWRIIGSGDSMIQLGNSSVGVTPLYLFGTGGFVYTVRSAMSTLLTHSSTDGTGRCIMTSLKNASNLKVAYRNGVAYPFTATEAPSAGTLNTFGQVPTLFTSGQVQEYIYWNSEQSANRTGIETNVNTYWNAY